MILILGAGESGIGAALLAKKHSVPAFVSDSYAIRPSFLSELVQQEIDFEENGHLIAYDISPDLVVKSPGIPDHADIVKHFNSQGIEIISEIEFAYRFCNNTIIGITGSNGKTTTTNLVYHLLKQNGIQAVKAGNVGYSFSRALAQNNNDVYVLELSSFQLDDISSFKPHIAILLNITPDHLDRYQNKFELYIKSKFRISKNQDVNDYLVYYVKDAVINEHLSDNPVKSKLIPVDVSLDEFERIYLNDELIAELSRSVLKGRHNAINAACAIQAAKLIGISGDGIQSALDSFVNDPHRLESILTIDGIEFINDSKATNVDSVFWALDAMKKKVIWIAGGQDKGNDYTVLKPLIEKKVKALVCLGIDNQKLKDVYQGVIPIIHDTRVIEDAVNMAFKLAVSGEVVLLSPACASFDLFSNYEDRGQQFKREVQKLIANTE